MRIGLKNKFFISFHILLSGLLLGLFSTSYAMSKGEALEICRQNCGASFLFDTPNTSPGNSSWLSYSDYLNYLNNKTERVMVVIKNNNAALTSSSASPNIDFYDNLDNSTSNIILITTNSRYGDYKVANQSQAYLNFYRPNGRVFS